MKTTRMFAVLMISIAFALVAPVHAASTPIGAPAPATDGNEEDSFVQLAESCCSKCEKAAERLCKGGKVKNFDCGGFPCECNFECANGYDIDGVYALVANLE